MANTHLVADEDNDMAISIRQKRTVGGGRLIDYNHFETHTPFEAPRLRKSVVKAASFEAIIDPDRRANERPTLKIARRLWKSMRIVEGGDLSARAWALYYLMLAKIGSEWNSGREMFELELADAARFLGERKDRIPALVTAIDQTKADFRIDDSYRYRAAKALPLMSCQIVGKQINFRPDPVYMWSWREAREYTEIELDAVARFRSRYTSVIYPRLARIAGFDEAAIKPLNLDPKSFADVCKYDWDGHLGNLQARLIEPIQKDIKASVRSFKLSVSRHRDVDTDKPYFTVCIEPTSRPLAGVRVANISKREKSCIRSSWPGLAQIDHPAVSLVARAVTLTGYDPISLMKSWTEYIVPARSGDQANEITALIDDYGVAVGFARWSEMQPKKPLDKPVQLAEQENVFLDILSEYEDRDFETLKKAAGGEIDTLNQQTLFDGYAKHWDCLFKNLNMLVDDRRQFAFAIHGFQYASNENKQRMLSATVEACEKMDILRMISIYEKALDISQKLGRWRQEQKKHKVAVG
ncbi:RepB family plasmid replication initiator protein [Rhizobium johnstonii]|nr:RepB family plasmid replication initiator protein [Rhizobium johnstonii]